MKRTLDRIENFDERSRNFPVTALRTEYSMNPRSYTWRCDKTLDQGPDGACTGFAVSHEAAARPKVIDNVTYDIAMNVYHRAQQLDPWPGEDYEGSSVLAAMKAGVEHGWYSEYRWAFGEGDLAWAVGHCGPAVLGIPWYTGMFTPDSDGFIAPTGHVAGGHALICNGYSYTKRIYRLHNSWGPNWGLGGYAFIKADDLAKLLAERGEACIPTKRLWGDNER
jgi:hypothetical protein